MSAENVLACAACFQDYDESDRRPLLLQCTHYFCKKCLLQMQTSGNKQCSTCNHSWADTSVDQLVVYQNLVPEITIKTEAGTGLSAAGSCKHTKYAEQFWCQDCKVLFCRTCRKEHKDCKWCVMDDALNDVMEEYKKQIISEKNRVTSRIDLAICETKEKLSNITAVINISIMQRSILSKYSNSLSNLLKTTVSKINKSENTLPRSQNSAKLREIMVTVRDLGATTIPEQPQVNVFQPTMSADHSSSSLQPVTTYASSLSTDQASNLTPDHDLDLLYYNFLTVSEQQRNEVCTCVMAW